MIEVRYTETFRNWLNGLRDRTTQARITIRLRRAESGNLGDWKAAGEGVSEMRLTYGPGYRLYFVRRGNEIIVMLGGGTKGTQRTDIARAIRMGKELEE